MIRRMAMMAALVLVIAASVARAADDADKQLYDAWAEGMEKSLLTWNAQNKFWDSSIGWQEGPMLRALVDGYAYSGDPRWLKHLTKQVDDLVGRLKTEPIKNDPAAKPYPGWGHSIHGEAMVLEPILEFVELAQTDKKMPEEYRKKAAEYLKQFEPVMITKFFEAGRWHDTWLDSGTYVEGITLPHNKNGHVGMMLLVAARVTPSSERRADYLDKAARLARQWQKFLIVKDDRFIWHYWDAAGPWDFEATGASKHWTNLEHRGYGVSDTTFVAAAYDSGLVFSREAVERHCRTFLKEIWNGDRENPKYKALGTFNPDYAQAAIYTGLARFDPQILEFFGQDASKEPKGWGGMSAVPAYLLAKRQGVGFERRHADQGEFLKKAMEKRVAEKKPDPGQPVVK